LESFILQTWSIEMRLWIQRENTYEYQDQWIVWFE
jgi:hypothetical protein